MTSPGRSRSPVALRAATQGDIPRLQALIADSARGLCRSDYTEPQIEAALQGAWSVDSQLIADGTYFVAGSPQILGCGGWSWRRTLFGGDAQPGRRADPLDPEQDAARIRAFFVHPAHGRRGIGRALLQHCEGEARARGFRAAELMATLAGQRLYAACGYEAGPAIEVPLPGEQRIVFVPMRKALEPQGTPYAFRPR